jgi:hypothetical protein
LGEGTRARRGGINKIRPWEGHFLAATDKKVIMVWCVCVSTIFRENHPEGEIGQCSRMR